MSNDAYNKAVEADAQVRPRARRAPFLGRRSLLRYVAWPTRDFGSRDFAWLRVGFGATWLAHALVASHAPVGRSQRR
jgi:hypothetical protein